MNGKTAVFTRDEQRAQLPGGHAPVVVGGKLKANDGIYPVGLLLKRDADGLTWIQSAAGDTHAGVLDTTIDTSLEASGPVVIHGSVQTPVLKVGAVAQAAPPVADLIELTAHGIFPG